MLTWESIGTLIAIIGSTAGLLKYIFYLLDKNKEYVDGRFKENKNRLEKHDVDIRANEKMLQKTREELNRDFVRHDHLDKQMNLHGEMLTAIFTKIDAMARDLNRLIGSHNKKVDDNDNDLNASS